MLWLLMIVYVFNYLDRQIVSILAELIRKELNLSDTQIGLLTGLAFALFYAVLGLPIAKYADRPNTDRSKIIGLSVAIWSLMTALSGLAVNFVQLLLARIGVGIGEAGCTPPAHSLIADRFPPNKRSGAMAFYALGVPIGSLLGMVLGGLLADTIGWRHTLMLVGTPGLLLALLFVVLVKDGSRQSINMPSAPPVQDDSVITSVRILLRSRTLVVLCPSSGNLRLQAA